MFIRIIYFTLLVIEIYVMYISGIRLQRTFNVFSKAGIFAIFAYTLNEGLRFGRGVDYNIYWDLYAMMEQGIEYSNNIGFYIWEKLLIYFSVPWQGCVMSMSFFYIIASLVFFKNYKEIVPIALPLWILLNRNIANNLIRWYFAFSFILIALYFLIKNKGKIDLKYVIFSFLAISIHYGIMPIPIIFYWLYNREKPIMSPGITIMFFFIISFFFQASILLHLENFFTTLSEIIEQFGGYGNDMGYWLTKSSGGIHANPWIGILDTFLGLFITIVAYKPVRKESKKYIFIYNLFIIGFIFRPATIQVELLHRYDELFFAVKALAFAYVFYLYKRKKFEQNIKLITMMIVVGFFLCFVSGTKDVYKEKEFKLLYVWDKDKHTPESMISLYINENFNKRTDK